uniref:PlsC domain-containing protein n=1 Tax=Rhabditophanes sp. KR3021 TaxID=114890 RepID=A0AC35TLX8_9BILA
MNIQIQNLLDESRFSNSLLTKGLFFCYLPIGITIFVLRVIIGFYMFCMACVFRKNSRIRSLILRIISMVMGIVVINEGPAGHWDKKTRLLVSNHVSAIDHFAIELSQSCTLPSVWDIPNWIRFVLGYADLGAKKGREEFVKQVRAYLANKGGECNACDTSLPLLAFPEGTITNGKYGLLQFSCWPFEVSDIVQPIGLQIRRPFFNGICCSTIAAAWWEDVFYFLIVPLSIVHINWLSPLYKKPDEKNTEFADRCSVVLSSFLGIKKTTLTSAEINEAVKRYLFENRKCNGKSPIVKSVKNNVTESQLNSYAFRIKQAHPKIHIATIKECLIETRDQEETIRCILNGSLNDASDKAYAKHTELTTKLRIMPEDAKALFEERRWNMIEMNRKKYIEQSKQILTQSRQINGQSKK